MTSLALDGNNISNLKPLAAMPKLTQLWLNQNYITDISLIDLEELESLWISGNKISELPRLEPMTSLRNVGLPKPNFGLKHLGGLDQLRGLMARR